MVHSSSIETIENNDGVLHEGEETFENIIRLAHLKIKSSFGSIIEEDERVWRNPLFEPPPFLIFHQEERTKEHVDVREVEEREGEYMSEVEA